MRSPSPFPFLLLPSLLPLVSLVHAEGLTINYRPSAANCVSGCFDALVLLVFSDIPATAGYYDGHCTSVDFTTSLALCAKTYCSASQQVAGWARISGRCEEYGDVALASFGSLVALLDHVSVMDVNAIEETGGTVSGTVMIDEASFKAGFRTENVWDREMAFHHAYGWSMYLLLGGALLVGISNRLLNIYRTRLLLNAAGASPGADRSEVAPHSSFTSRSYASYRRYLGTPAFLGYKHAQTGIWFSLPTRLQAVLIFLYVLINVIFCCTGYETFAPNLYWSDIPDQVWRYVADRTAIMSFYNLPLLWCLAGRNDLILWLTGWSFASMNLFHRWVARVTVVQAIVHSAAWTWIEREYIPSMFAEMYWATGVFATVVMCLLLPFSIKPLRERWYEVFLITHIVLALAALVLLFYHVTVYDGQYNPYLWACVTVWCLDRFCRIVRAVILSYTAARGKNATAVATGGNSGLVRLSVKTAITFTPKPGEHFYLYTPRSLTPWENHPFTLASWEKSPDDRTEKGCILHFLIATKSGATRRLRRQLDKSSTGQATTRILIEGPYGHTAPLEAFEHILLVAGGSGITALLPYLFDLRQRRRASASAKEKCIARRISLVWVVRSAKYAADVLQHELAEYADIPGLVVEIVVYATTGAATSANAFVAAVNADDESTPSSASSPQTPAVPALSYQIDPQGQATPSQALTQGSDEPEEKNKEISLDSHAKAVARTGRPEMSDVLSASLGQVVGSERLAVLACGPGGMMDDMRKAVSLSYGSEEGQVGGGALEYFEESFTW